MANRTTYDDSAYLLRLWMQRPFTRGIWSDGESDFKNRMSEVRIIVEQRCRDLKNYLYSQEFSRRLKIRHALLYNMSDLLTSFRSCLHKGG